MAAGVEQEVVAAFAAMDNGSSAKEAKADRERLLLDQIDEAAADAIVNSSLAHMKGDPALAFEKRFIAAAAYFSRHDHARYDRLRRLIKDKGVTRLTEFDRDVRQRRSEDEQREKAAGGAGAAPGRENQASVIASLGLQACELFHDANGGYASFVVKGHLETWRIDSRGFRLFLTQLFFMQKGTAPSAENVKAALNLIEAQARFKAPARTVYLRAVEHECAVYIDVGDEDWRVIAITSAGWKVIKAAQAPVRFRRTNGMKSLPMPERGGKIGELRKFVNVKADAEFILLVSFMVAVLRGKGPFPLLLLLAEQGGAKSTLLRVVRALLDPNKPAIRTWPREPRDFAISAENSFVLFFDNASSIVQWLSDLLCQAATGGGFAVRTHYENREEELFDFMRPVGITAIEEVITAGDLQDRAVTLSLPEIEPGKRLTEEEFWKQFNAAAPRILGALLDGVQTALANVRQVRVADLPRMADFALWAAAAAPAFGWIAEQFLDAYNANRKSAKTSILATSLVAPHIRGLSVDGWSGTARELLAKVNSLTGGEAVNRERGWPKDPAALSNHLRRLVPALRASGLLIEFKPPAQGKRIITISQAAVEAKPAEVEEGLDV